MPSAEDKSGEPKLSDKEYTDIIKSESAKDKKYIEGTGVPVKIIYFCQDCKKIIAPKRIGKKFRFSCPECKKDNVSFGSEKSILSYFRPALVSAQNIDQNSGQNKGWTEKRLKTKTV